MRIIAGDFKGRRLYTPNDKNVRPTSDKVRGAIFSILQDRMEGCVFCDLFAGTGGVGIEALSRGAKFCYFGDHAQESISLLKKNVEHVGAQDICSLTHGSFIKTLERIPEKVDIFFLDPPYEKGLIQQAVAAIKERDLLAEEGIIVCEHGKYETIADDLCGYRKVKEKKYGIVVLSLFMC